MPVKQRRSKRRTDPLAEAKLWAALFATGHDFSGEDALTELGFTEGDIIACEHAARAAMPDAWRRLGRLYLDHDLGRGFASHDEGRPYALVQFGEPEQCR